MLWFLRHKLTKAVYRNAIDLIAKARRMTVNDVKKAAPIMLKMPRLVINTKNFRTLEYKLQKLIDARVISKESALKTLSVYYVLCAKDLSRFAQAYPEEQMKLDSELKKRYPRGYDVIIGERGGFSAELKKLDGKKLTVKITREGEITIL